jgi:hypothetical protein
MFTLKQSAEFKEYMKTARVEDLNTPDMPELDLPSWLPKEVQAVLTEHVEIISQKKWAKERLYVDMWPHFVRYVTRVLPAFRADTIRKVWQELYEESAPLTQRFARHLLQIENDFDGAVSMYQKHRNEKEYCAAMIQKAKELHDLMEEYQCHYYGHMLQKNHHRIMKNLKKFWKDSQQALSEFQDETGDISYLFSDHAPITREFRAKEALPVFFSRKMSLFFTQEFGKPKHKIVADFINVMFDVQYSENEVTKLARRLKPLWKPDNSYPPKK